MLYIELIIKRINELCRKYDYTYNKLATMSDIPQSTLDNIMRGETKNPRIATLHKIALTFGMTLSEFLDFPELNEFSFDETEE